MAGPTFNMVLFPNCKINLGLRILRKREDGYHDLETVFYPLPVKDVLEIIRDEQLRFTAYGLPIPGDTAGNLCLKAWQLLKKDFPELPFVHIHLYKNIPIGAGLGGGSSDGAFLLQMLNRQFKLGLSTEELINYAVQLGSDCPFFILNTPCIGGGRGERLEPLQLDLSGYTFVLVDPGLHVSTAQAFALCKPGLTALSVKDLIQQPVGAWRGQLVNDFEEPVFRLHPSLQDIKELLYAHGALYASLTGSGSSLFGIFEKGKAPVLPADASYKIIRVA